MDAVQILESSHARVLETLDDLSEPLWDVPGVCGEWSVKDIVAHLASYERVVIDVLKTFQGDEPTPYMLRYFVDNDEFNKAQVEARKYLTAQQVMNEYQEAEVQSASLLEQVPADVVQRVGTLPWYDPEHCLKDFIGGSISAQPFCRHLPSGRGLRYRAGQPALRGTNASGQTGLCFVERGQSRRRRDRNC